MATDQAEPVAGVVNTQPEPKGGTGTHTYRLVVVAALFLLGIGWAVTHPVTHTATLVQTEPAATAPDPTEIQQERDRLRAMRLGSDPAAPASRPTRAQLPQSDNGQLRDASPNSGDQLAEERRRRNYDSLFASNLVKTDGAAGARSRSTTVADESPAVAGKLPTLEELTDRVMKQMGTSAPTAGAPAPPGSETQSLTPEPSTPITGEPAVSRGTHRVFEGTIIDASLSNRLSGDMDSPVNVMVTNPVYAQDGTLVIPGGARVLGEAKRVSSFGTTRVAVTFHRLILPNGRSYGLDHFSGLNQIGDAGLRDQVNHHYLSTFGAAAAVGVISGLSQSIGRGIGGQNNTVVIAGGVTDSTSQAVAQTMQQYSNRPWGVTIMEGHRVKVYLTSDLNLPAYGGEL